MSDPGSHEPELQIEGMQTASNFHNKVVLGLELGEVSYVESGYRALHLNRGSAGSTR